PSGIGLDGSPRGVAASTKDLDDVIAAFAQAARDAKRIGFDGVELHGAHGYLLDSFAWAFSNRREDAYGGSVEGRARLAAEIVAPGGGGRAARPPPPLLAARLRGLGPHPGRLDQAPDGPAHHRPRLGGRARSLQGRGRGARRPEPGPPARALPARRVRPGGVG